MRKWLTKIASLLVFLFMTPSVLAEENKIESIEIQVELHEDGSATIREKRQMEVVEDTEIYIELSELGESELIDFEVAGFEEMSDWDIEASFEEKAYRYGVLDVTNGYELAWGISQYGEREYDVTYRLTNMVRNLEDGQALFWNFDTFLSFPTERLVLEISADFAGGQEFLDYYAFGFEGPTDITNGRFKWTGFGLDGSNDIIVLLQYPPNTFQTNASFDMTLAEQREMALEGSSYNDTPPMTAFEKGMVGLLVFLGLGSGTTGVAYALRRNKIREENNHFAPHKFIAANKDKTTEIPPQLSGDIANYSGLISRLNPAGAGFSEFFFAYLLLWADQRRITIETYEEDRLIFGPEKKATIYIPNYKEEYEMNTLYFDEYVELFEIGQSSFEEVIWGMLLEVADVEGAIKGDDLQDWSEKNADSIGEVIDSLDTISMQWLHDNDYLHTLDIKDWGFNVKVEQLTNKGKQLATEIVQYDNFIEQIDESSLENYQYWEELIVWAAVLDHAEETIEYLEEFEPGTWAYLEESYPYLYGNYFGYHYLYMTNSKGLASAGYSSTGSGFSSAGGGMGAGGGGGGGSR